MVTSYTQLLAKRYHNKLDSDAQEFIAYAVDGGKRMRTLIDDLLMYSRLGTQATQFQTVCCEDIVRQALANLEAMVSESGASITRDPMPTVLTDAGQLVQVFQNLISNAIKYRSRELPQVHIGAESRGKNWRFSVSDNGIGIEPRHAERIFAIFQRLHTREEFPGTGIGLAQCQKIVDRHGGHIWVESELGKGSTFYFTLPVEREEQN